MESKMDDYDVAPIYISAENMKQLLVKRPQMNIEFTRGFITKDSHLLVKMLEILRKKKMIRRSSGEMEFIFSSIMKTKDKPSSKLSFSIYDYKYSKNYVKHMKSS